MTKAEHYKILNYPLEKHHLVPIKEAIAFLEVEAEAGQGPQLG